MTIALTYLRVSQAEQAREGTSLFAQRAACHAYVQEHGWERGPEFTDIFSGLRDDRPHYQRLFKYVEVQQVVHGSVVVVVAALDRLGRRLVERVRAREQLRELGVVVHSVREGGEVSDFVSNMLAAVAQEESRLLGERVREAWEFTHSCGFSAASTAAWGYRRREATNAERSAGAPRFVLELEPDAAGAVRGVFQRVADGASFAEVSRWLATLGPAQRQGRVLSGRILSRLVRSPTYVARFPGTSEPVLQQPPQRWPAIVDDATWQRVQQVLARKRPPPGAERSWLTGYFRCPRCGGAIDGGSTHHGQAQYRCTRCYTRSVPVACSWTTPTYAIDEPVRNQIEDLLLAVHGMVLVGQLADLREAWEQLPSVAVFEGPRHRRLQRLQEELRHEHRRRSIADLQLADGALNREGYRSECARFHTSMRSIQAQLSRARRAPPPPPLANFDELLAALPRWRTLLFAPEVAAQREVVRDLVDFVTCTKLTRARYQVSVTWSVRGQMLWWLRQGLRQMRCGS